jgi:hypothetical protein
MSKAKRKRRLEPTRSIMPTPERMAKSEGYLHIVQSGSETFTTVRDAPIDRLHDRWKSKPSDNGVNDQRYRAAAKLRLHWHHSGLVERFAAIDPNTVFSRAEASCGMPTSEFMAHHRGQYRRAVQALGMRLSAHVEAIVCRDFEIVEAGRRLGYQDEKQARAAGMIALMIGLDQLAAMWGT